MTLVFPFINGRSIITAASLRYVAPVGVVPPTPSTVQHSFAESGVEADCRTQVALCCSGGGFHFL